MIPSSNSASFPCKNKMVGEWWVQKSACVIYQFKKDKVYFLSQKNYPNFNFYLKIYFVPSMSLFTQMSQFSLCNYDAILCDEKG